MEGFAKVPVRLVRIENQTNKEDKVRAVKSNDVLYFYKCIDCKFTVMLNQKMTKVFIEDCERVSIQFLDSIVIKSRQCCIINSKHVDVLFDCIDIRNVQCYNSENIKIQFTDFSTILENVKIYWIQTSSSNSTTPFYQQYIERTHFIPEADPNLHVNIPLDMVKSIPVKIPKSTQVVNSNANNQVLSVHCSTLPDGEEVKTIEVSDTQPFGLDTLRQEIASYEQATTEFNSIPKENLATMYQEEIRELSDSAEDISAKVKQIAEAIKQSKRLIIHTGAGVSTAASIPDYRGPQGAWTMQKQGRFVVGGVEMESVKPTFTHYAIAELLRRDIAKFLVSSNLDGLHRRSGVPEHKLAEIHGNCYREVCQDCGLGYLRNYDVLRSVNNSWSHLTGRKCTRCNGPLRDTIIHFTENLFPNVWQAAVTESKAADVSLVLGTSLNVQPGASLVEKPLSKKNGKLFIVNLQRTPLDSTATLTVHAKTDEFMKLLLQELHIENIDTAFDRLEYAEDQQVFLTNALIITTFLSAIAAFAFVYLQKK